MRQLQMKELLCANTLDSDQMFGIPASKEPDGKATFAQPCAQTGRQVIVTHQ